MRITSRVLHGYRLTLTYSDYDRLPINPSWSVFQKACRPRERIFRTMCGNLLHATVGSGIITIGALTLNVPGCRAQLTEDAQTLINKIADRSWSWGCRGTTKESLQALLAWLIDRTWQIAFTKARVLRAKPTPRSEEYWKPIPHDPNWEPRPQDDPADYSRFLERIERCPDVTTYDVVTHFAIASP